MVEGMLPHHRNRTAESAKNSDLIVMVGTFYLLEMVCSGLSLGTMFDSSWYLYLAADASLALAGCCHSAGRETAAAAAGHSG